MLEKIVMKTLTHHWTSAVMFATTLKLNQMAKGGSSSSCSMSTFDTECTRESESNSKYLLSRWRLQGTFHLYLPSSNNAAVPVECYVSKLLIYSKLPYPSHAST